MDRKAFLKRASFGLGALSLGLTYQREAEAITQPNILVFITDDQPKRRTWKREVTPQIFSRIVDTGLEYAVGYPAIPLCGPTRWSMVTGKYPHNHGVTSNLSSCHQDGLNRGLDKDTPATRAKAMGYRCGYFGKYINGYDNTPQYLPPGYDLFAWYVWASVAADEPNYRFNEYGTLRSYSIPPTTTEKVTNAALRFVNEQASRTEPFLAHVSYNSPHSPYKPSAEHADDFDNDPLDIYPSMNLSSKQIQGQQDVQEGKKEEMRDVDDGVEAIFAALESTGQLANTLVIFTSDNGYNLGEHGAFEKSHPWEESVHIPFAVTGPGVPAGTKSRALVSHVDIPVTIADLVGSPAPEWDGRSLVPTFSGTMPEGWRKKLLIEDPPKKWRMIRSEEYAYIHRYGQNTFQIFDMTTTDGDFIDTYQMTNLEGTAEGASVKNTYQPTLDALRVCQGATCRTQEAL